MRKTEGASHPRVIRVYFWLWPGPLHSLGVALPCHTDSWEPNVRDTTYILTTCLAYFGTRPFCCLSWSEPPSWEIRVPGYRGDLVRSESESRDSCGQLHHFSLSPGFPKSLPASAMHNGSCSLEFYLVRVAERKHNGPLRKSWVKNECPSSPYD